MKAFTQIITIDWINAIGWTLLHSLWQASILLLLVTIVLKLVPTLRSGLRYSIVAAGLLSSTAVSIVTFIHLLGKPTGTNTVATTPILHHAVYFPESATEQSALLPSIISLLEKNMTLIVALWALGFLVFALRWGLGLYHSYRIRSGARPLGGEWCDYLQRTAKALAIARPVSIAESIAITAPMVLGYVKPLILIPTGMIAGLSTQQLETIILHELAHIRRNDYLMNFFQTIIESIFFFNPFVRMLSNQLRCEREYCCDDIVVGMHGNKSAYAHALVRVAEAQLVTPAFALPLMGQKNQLLTRIKRIMEGSAETSTLKSRFLLPALLFAGALASISWISADGDDEPNNSLLSEVDTVPDKSRTGARFSTRRMITIDENGRPHEEVIQEFEGNEELRALLENNSPIFDDTAFANAFLGIAPGGHLHSRSMMQLWNDTIPPFNQKQWREFADAFDERFENLFQGNPEISKFLDDFDKNFQWEQWATPFENIPFDSLGKLRHDDVFKNFKQEFEKFREFAPEGLEDFRRGFPSFDNPIQRYERALREQLVDDGYLSPGESIESLQWSDDSFKVNGKSLKPEDVKKYNDLRKGLLERNSSDKVE